MKLFPFVLLILLISIQPLFSSINKKAYKAIKENSLYKLKKAVNSKNVNEKNDDGENILNYSIQIGNLKIIKYLLKLNVDINNKAKINYKFVLKKGKVTSFVKIKEDDRKAGDTPLIIAIRAKKEDIIRLLIEKGAIINLKGNRSNIPLNVAIENNYFDIVKLLIEKGADVNPKYESWNTPLIIAIRNNNLEMIKLLIESGADINKVNVNNITPLTYSLSFFELGSKFSKKRFNIIKYLVNKGAKLEEDAIFLSINTASIELINFLFNKGAKLSQKGKYGETEFERAAQKGYLVILKKFLSIKKDKEIINKSLFKAISSGNNKMINYLISIGADVNYVDEKSGKNILIRSIEMKNFSLVKKLVEKGGNVDFISKYGYTPLMASINDLNMIKYLVRRGAKINLYNPRFNQNLLSYSISMGNNNNDVVKFLIKKRANSKHAFYNAVIKFNKEIVELLLNESTINKKYKGDTPLTAAIKYASYNIQHFQRNSSIKGTISLLISKNAKIDKEFLESKELKSFKKLYKFTKKELQKYKK